MVVYYKFLQHLIQAIEVWFTDQNSQPLEIEDRINSTLVIKWYSHYKRDIQLSLKIEYMQKGMDFCFLLKTWVHI